MATFITEQFSRKEARNYVVLDRRQFAKECEARLLALGASALLEWISLVKGRFSTNTAARYLESLYFDTGNPRRLTLGVLPDTLASSLEGGQSPHELNAIFLKGATKRTIPMGDTGTYESNKRAPDLTKEGISKILDTHSPTTAKFLIASKVNSFSRTNAGTHTYTPGGFFIRDGHPDFAVITPSKTWKHPGIKAALLANQVSTWIQSERARFAAPILQGDPGIPLPGGDVF
jgi:hypothetical protein